MTLHVDEEDVTTLGGEFTDEFVGLFEQGDGLLEIENVDAVALGEDVRLHLRVPAVLLVTEVNAGLQERLEADWLVPSLCRRHILTFHVC